MVEVEVEVACLADLDARYAVGVGTTPFGARGAGRE